MYGLFSPEPFELLLETNGMRNILFWTPPHTAPQCVCVYKATYFFNERKNKNTWNFFKKLFLAQKANYIVSNPVWFLRLKCFFYFHLWDMWFLTETSGRKPKTHAGSKPKANIASQRKHSHSLPRLHNWLEPTPHS